MVLDGGSAWRTPDSGSTPDASTWELVERARQEEDERRAKLLAVDKEKRRRLLRQMVREGQEAGLYDES